MRVGVFIRCKGYTSSNQIQVYRSSRNHIMTSKFTFILKFIHDNNWNRESYTKLCKTVNQPSQYFAENSSMASSTSMVLRTARREGKRAQRVVVKCRAFSHSLSASSSTTWNTQHFLFEVNHAIKRNRWKCNYKKR